MRLNKDQKKAVEYLGGPLLVLAGPGTGKTQLLSGKVKYILENTDADPDNILCITFTESGATNMQERLVNDIGVAAYNVHIHTYHALGADILQQYRNYASTYQRPLEENIDDVTAVNIVHDLMQALDPLDPLRSNSAEEVKKKIGAAKQARLSASDLIKIGEHNRRQAKEYLPEVSDLLRHYTDAKIRGFAAAREEVFQPILEILAEYTSPEPIAGQIEPLVNVLVRKLDEAIKSQEGAEKPTVTALTAGWRDKFFEKAPNGDYRLGDHVANMKLTSVAQIYDQYQHYLEQNGLYDYNDMIEEAVKVLQEDAGFRATLQERYQYILLDEFQDTNPSQFKIIELLTDYEQPQVMAVGDDDQTIFEFQGARPDNLLDFKNNYNAEMVNLTQNYRSTGEIVALGRAVADKIPDSFAKTAGVEKRLVAMRDKETCRSASGVPFRAPGRQPVVTGDDPIVRSRRRVDPSIGTSESALQGSASSQISRHEFTAADGEYAWVSRQIRELLDAGEAPKEIAIITPHHKFIEAMLPYLKAQNIPLAYEKDDDILQEPKIAELNYLAKFVYQLSQAEQPTHKLLELLTFSFWEVPAETALRSVQRDKKPTLDYLAESGEEKLQKVGKILAELVAKSFEVPLEQFLDMLVGVVEIAPGVKSPFLEYYGQGQDYAAFELYNNLETLREACLKHTKAQNLRLADYVKFLDDYERAGEAVRSTSPYQDAENSVQAMTVHKSKGLEFKHVFLVAVDNVNWGKSKGNMSRLSLPKNLEALDQDGTNDSELMRKFFVAITRAKDHLVMTNAKENFAGKRPPRIEYLEEREDEAGKLLSPLIPSGEVATHYEDIEAAKLRGDLQLGWQGYYLKLTPNLEELAKKQLENYRLTASDLTAFVDVIYSGPQSFYQRKVLRMPQERTGASQNLGNIVHATFEKVTKDGINDDAALEFCREQIAELPLTEVERTELESMAQYSLGKSLAKFGQIIRAEGAQAEVNFRSERINLDGVPLTGVIDHLNIDQKQKTIEVYDFKTKRSRVDDLAKKGWNTKEVSLLEYKLQLGFYKLLLNLSPKYRDYKVTRGHILFVYPDKFDAVYDKPYEYNAADETRLKELIRAVYAQVKSLDFLKNPELNVPADSGLGYNDVAKFIELVLASRT